MERKNSRKVAAGLLLGSALAGQVSPGGVSGGGSGSRSELGSLEIPQGGEPDCDRCQGLLDGEKILC